MCFYLYNYLSLSLSLSFQKNLQFFFVFDMDKLPTELLVEILRVIKRTQPSASAIPFLSVSKKWKSAAGEAFYAHTHLKDKAIDYLRSRTAEQLQEVIGSAEYIRSLIINDGWGIGQSLNES